MHQTWLLSPYPSLAFCSYLRLFGGLRGGQIYIGPFPSWTSDPPITCKSYFIWNEQRSQLYVSKHSKIKNQTSWFSNQHWLLWYTNLRVCSMHSYLHYNASLSPIPPNSYLFVLSNVSPLLKSVLNPKIKCLVSSIDLDPSRYYTFDAHWGSYHSGHCWI